MHSRPAQIFWDFRLQLHGEVWAKTCLETNFQQIGKSFDHVTEALKVPRMSQNELSPGTFGLRSLRDVVKRLRNWLKIGLQARFGPNFTVEFEAEISQKKLGWPNV